MFIQHLHQAGDDEDSGEDDEDGADNCLSSVSPPLGYNLRALVVKSTS